MHIFLTIAAIGAFPLGILGLASVRSDIKLTLTVVGLFSGVILLGQASTIGTLNRWGCAG